VFPFLEEQKSKSENNNPSLFKHVAGAEAQV
jgi:hypothetical protein